MSVSEYGLYRYRQRSTGQKGAVAAAKAHNRVAVIDRTTMIGGVCEFFVLAQDDDFTEFRRKVQDGAAYLFLLHLTYALRMRIFGCVNRHIHNPFVGLEFHNFRRIALLAQMIQPDIS